jgi:large subunit ribosomal protein L12
MELIYSALLLHSLKQPITEENINKIFSALGVNIDQARVKALVAALEGVNIEEAISKATMPVTAAPVEAKAEKKEEKKEEEKEEKKEEEAVEGLASLFG